MAELRALVAVKRVIDFAVKVTGPTPSLNPAAVCFRGHERTLFEVLLVPLISAALTAKVKVTPEGKDQELRGSDARALFIQN